MTRDDVIRMAREAGINVEQGFLLRFAGVEDDLEAFAALVAEAKEAEFAERLRTDVHSCHANCQRVSCVAVREAVRAEREACAKVCLTEWATLGQMEAGEVFAAAIRARGQEGGAA